MMSDSSTRLRMASDRGAVRTPARVDIPSWSDVGALGAEYARSLQPEELAMGKAMDTKKDAKKKPAKSLMEKRAAKKEKKENKGYRG